MGAFDPKVTKNAATADERAEAAVARITLYLNIAAAHLRLEHWKEAIEECDKVLKVDGSNFKALFRRAQALSSRGDHEEALYGIKLALAMEPENADALRKLARFEKNLLEHSKTERKLFSRF